MRNLYSENAFTGLEAAIVLIAFVVVAAVFSYVVLGAGFFTSQTAQSTVHTGVSQASSSLQEVGNTYGVANSGTSPTGIQLCQRDRRTHCRWHPHRPVFDGSLLHGQQRRSPAKYDL